MFPSIARIRIASTRRVVALALVFLAVPAAVWAGHGDPDAPAELRFDVDADTKAHARIAADGRLQVTTTPGGAQWLTPEPGNEDGVFTLEAADANFDGHADLWVSAPVGQVNEVVTIYLFDPGSRRFRQLQPVANAPNSCGAFSTLAVDATARELTSQCRSGPMWYTDVFRYDAQGRLYVHRSEQLMHSIGVYELLDDAQEDGGPPVVWSTYSPRGEVLERVIGPGLADPTGGPLQPWTGTVADARMPLHASPSDAPTKRYLVKGDRFEALDVSPDGEWLKVRYRNPRRGAIEGWLRIPDPAL